jgi:hypothetical protein
MKTQNKGIRISRYGLMGEKVEYCYDFEEIEEKHVNNKDKPKRKVND